MPFSKMDLRFLMKSGQLSGACPLEVYTQYSCLKTYVEKSKTPSPIECGYGYKTFKIRCFVKFALM